MNEKAKWFVSLIQSVNSVAEELGLDDMGTSKLREFILEKCKEEYMAGNRSGIRWARENPPRVYQAGAAAAA